MRSKFLYFAGSLKPSWRKTLGTALLVPLTYWIVAVPCNQSRCVPGVGICGSEYCQTSDALPVVFVPALAIYVAWSITEAKKPRENRPRRN